MKEIILEVWGDFATFSPPYSKVERSSYACPTPSAARGILSAIYSKPKEFHWQINRIEILRPIQYISFKRNELKSTVNDQPIYAEDERTQRQTVALKDVRYRIAATIIPTPEFEGREKQLYEQAHRRISTGKCFMMPSFGLREFAAYFEEYDPEVHKDKPINVDMDLGLMVYDIFDPYSNSVEKKVKPKLSLFHAEIKQGVMTIPPYNSSEVIKGG